MLLNKKVLHRDVFLSTVLTFIILFLIKIVVVNVEYLNPIAKVFEDFQFTDIYYSEFKKNKTEIDTNLVIVNIGENDRLGIASQIEIIKSFKPRVIGLDVTFKDRKGDAEDSILKNALEGNIPVISVCNIVYDEEKPRAPFEIERSNPFFARSPMEGFGNFLGEEDQSVRYFTPFLYQANQQYSAFATKIIAIIDSDAYQRLLKRKRKTEIINYRSNHFPTLDVSDFSGATDLNFLRNKIVMMGYMGPDLEHKVFEDNHVTPLNKSYGGRVFPDKYGIEIHSSIISMVLSGTYINEMPQWEIFVVAFIVCMAHMYVFIYLFLNHHKWFHVGALSLQVVSFGLIVVISIVFFHLFKIKLEPTYILVGVLLSVESLYFYEALVKILHKYFNFKSCFIQAH